MKNSWLNYFVIAIFIITASWAYSKESNDALVVNAVKISLEDAIKIVKTQQKGKIVKMEIEHDDDHYFWDVEMVNEKKQVLDFEIDAMSGKLIKTNVDEDDQKENGSEKKDDD